LTIGVSGPDSITIAHGDTTPMTMAPSLSSEIIPGWPATV
jgi:hypothetical protein